MVQVERLADDATLIDDMRLPQGEDLDYLIDGLGNLIRRRGIEPLLLNPILLPEPRYFPDAFAPGPVGARRLLRRLLHYAALDYVVRLYVYDRFAPTQLGATFIVPEGAHTGAAAWYAGHEAGEAHFGVARNELRDVDELIGTLGHEVAHLYRDHHRLVVRDAAIEELLTDLTTVYLGFGVFLLLSSFSFKTGGYDGEPSCWRWLAPISDGCRPSSWGWWEWGSVLSSARATSVTLASAVERKCCKTRTGAQAATRQWPGRSRQRADQRRCASSLVWTGSWA